MAVSEHSDEIKKEANRQIERMLGDSAFEETVAKTIERELNLALNNYVNRVIKQALSAHEDRMKALVMENVVRLLAENQVDQLMHE